MLTTVNNLLAAHPYLVGFVASVMVNNAITAMPAPDDTTGKLYKWFFAFAHSLNIPRLIATFQPGLAAKMGMMSEEASIVKQADNDAAAAAGGKP